MITMVAFFFALLSLCFYYMGFTGAILGMSAFTLVLAILATAFGDKERPVSSRIVAWIAFLLSASPLAAPFVEDLRLQSLNRQRAIETAPDYEKINQSIEELKPVLEAYFRQTDLFPDVQGGELLQYVDANGALRTPPPPEEGELLSPLDPFAQGAGERLRWVAVRDKGILLVSVGQDGVTELPLPGVAMDGPPAHPFAGFAKLGINPRWASYDPTNGATSVGDLVKWYGKEDYDKAFKELFDAWDEAEGHSPYRPRIKRKSSDLGPDPQSSKDSQAAMDLYERQLYLAALAITSRAIQGRDQYEAQWTDEDRVAERTQGLALYQLGAFREASDALINYLILVPNDVMAQYYLAAALYRGGNKQQAKLHMAAAGQIKGDHPYSNQAWTTYEAMEQGSQPPLPPCWIEEQLKNTNDE